MISAGTTVVPLAAPIDGGLFTQTLSSPYFYGTDGSSLYSGGFGTFSGSYAASYGATYVGNASRYTGNGYSTPFDPYGPAPTGYGMNTALPVVGAPAPSAAPALGNQVVYALYGAPGQPTTTAGGAPASAAAPTPDPVSAAVPKPAAAPKPAATPQKDVPGKAAPKSEPRTVSVTSGDSLSKIAAANGTTWQKLYELNRSIIGGNPNLIRPGQDLKLP